MVYCDSGIQQLLLTILVFRDVAAVDGVFGTTNVPVLAVGGGADLGKIDTLPIRTSVRISFAFRRTELLARSILTELQILLALRKVEQGFDTGVHVAIIFVRPIRTVFIPVTSPNRGDADLVPLAFEVVTVAIGRDDTVIFIRVVGAVRSSITEER